MRKWPLMFFIAIFIFSFAIKFPASAETITGPKVKSISPTNKMKNVEIKSKISVVFNEGLKKGKKFALITLLSEDNHKVATTVLIKGSNLSITPKKELNYGTSYSVSIPAGAVSNSKDLPLKTAYKAGFTTVGIEVIEDLETTIQFGDEFSLPEILKARLTNGKVIDVQVNWDNEDTIDTSEPGEFTFEGQVPSYEGGVTFVLTIEEAAENEISFVEDLTFEVNQGEAFEFPETVQAELSDGTIVDVPITWEDTYIDTDIPGVYTFTGTIEGYEQEVTATIIIKEN